MANAPKGKAKRTQVRKLKSLTPHEATVLSYLARHKELRPEHRNRINLKLEGDARRIAQAIPKAAKRSKSSSSVLRTAKSLLLWAEKPQKQKRVASAAAGA